jgi:hypothetical protein
MPHALSKLTTKGMKGKAGFLVMAFMLLMPACSSKSDPAAISILPATASVNAGNSVTLSVTAQNTEITWPTLPESEGHFTTDGNQAVYFAPETASADFTVNFTVTATADSTKTATAQISVLVPKVLMSLTQTTAAAAGTDNRFNADSGVFANVSHLTAWNNNAQITIGGTLRTPVVINNAAAGAWRSVGSAAADAGVTVDTATAFQVKYSTTGYESITFSASQKSTGSGPESFALAYSAGSPTGPYTVIPGSKINNFRVGDDTYAALKQSYAEFPLPAEAEDKAEVYLRVYMVDSALANRSNGNTSINDIKITGKRITGNKNTVPVDKSGLNAGISAAIGKVQDNYTPESWAVLALALSNAQAVSAAGNAAQAQVDYALSLLLNAIDALALVAPPARPLLDARSDKGVMTYLGSYWTGATNSDGAVAEIVAYNKDNKKMYVVSGLIQALDIVPLLGITSGTNDNSLSSEKRVEIGKIGETYGFIANDITSVDINTRLKAVAISVQHRDYEKDGYIVFLDYDGNYIAHYGTGSQPDMIGFSPDGNYVMTANEGEPRMGYGAGTVDPEGSVTIIDLSGINDHNALKTLAANRVTTVGFHAFDAYEKRERLIADLVLLKPNTAPSVDLEPEYIAFSKDSAKAYVSLQEANAIATFDIATKTFTSIKGLGFKNHGLPVNAIDISSSGPIDIKTQPNVYGVYMPDGLAAVNIGGVQYVLTPNEGDARSDWPGYNDVQRGGSIYINGIPNVEHLINAEREILKDRPADFFLLGARSFSIWNASDMSLVYDSGSDFETITARLFPDNFNSNHAAANYKGRGGRKGPEPEDIKVLQIGLKYYAFIGLERIGGIMMYDITDPANVSYADYLNVRDFSSSDLENGSDLGAEGICVIPAEDSPTGRPMILVANEVSGSVTVIQINTL